MLPGITIDHGLTNNFLHLCSLLFGRQECRFERLLLHLPSLLVNTVLENGIPQCLKITQNVAFESLILAFSTSFCLVALFDSKLQVFKNSQKLTIFGIFYDLLSTQIANLARFARNVECDFFGDF